MKRKSKNSILTGVSIALAALVVMLAITSSILAHADRDEETEINPPPFDFADFFYKRNGIDLAVLNSPDAERFRAF
jgi:hypothetical protein